MSLLSEGADGSVSLFEIADMHLENSFFFFFGVYYIGGQLALET